MRRGEDFAAALPREGRVVRIMCRRCLRFWDAPRVAERSSCPHCGGALADR